MGEIEKILIDFHETMLKVDSGRKATKLAMASVDIERLIDASYNKAISDAANAAEGFTIHMAQPLTKITGAIGKESILKLLK